MPKVAQLANIICQPNPKIFDTPEEADAEFRKNRVLLFLHAITTLVGFVFLQISTIQQRALWSSYSILSVFEISVFCLLCRSYPSVLKTFYFASITLTGPCSVYFLEDAYSLCWVSIHIFPLYVLYVHGLLPYIFQVLLQICFSEFLYKPYITNMVIHSNPVLFVEEMMNVSMGGMITNLIVISMIISALKKANQKVTVHKMKQNELERQKAFLLGFSHELRNITNSLLGNIQVALIEKTSEKVKDLLNSCENFGGLLLNLINNALDIGKAEVGELEINPTSTVIHDTFEKIWNISVQLIKNRQLEGFMRIHNKLPQILKVDHYRFMQIVINLVMNAVKFTEKGSVTIDVQWIDGIDSVEPEHFEPFPYDETDEGLFEKNESISLLMKDQIVLNLNQTSIDRKRIKSHKGITKGVIKVIIKDNGCGISQEKLQNVFKKADESSYKEGNTKRLGIRSSLYVTNRLVEKMKGEIRAYSQINKGATFILCLPLQVEEENWAKAVTKEEVKVFIESSSPKVFIVDDMQFNRMILKNYFQKIKFTKAPEEARNGQEAFEIFKSGVNFATKQSFDIITMDVEMPILDGKRAVELIRNYEHENNLTPCLIIMVSGNCSESEILGCLNPNKITGLKNADYFLKKPISIDDLSNVITSWYQRKLTSSSI